jgi:superfamily I DNA/RNA helicase
MFVNPHDDTSLLRIANVPARGLSDVTMERLLAASQERGGSVYSVLRHTDVQASFVPRTRESMLAFLEFIERVRGQLQGSPTLSLRQWADRFLDEIGYFADLRRAEKNPEAAESRIRNLQELLAELDGEEKAPPEERLQEFLEGITLDTEREEEAEGQGNAVTLITMHSCKGLEFPHVQVVGLEDGLLPHMRSKTEGTLDEERRLFYVAITRAMQTLRLSYCLGRKKYGAMIHCQPSPFLRELPEHLVENAATSARQPVAPSSGQSIFATMRAAAD